MSGIEDVLKNAGFEAVESKPPVVYKDPSRSGVEVVMEVGKLPIVLAYKREKP